MRAEQKLSMIIGPLWSFDNLWLTCRLQKINEIEQRRFDGCFLCISAT
jgi:hypothetical protein